MYEFSITEDGYGEIQIDNFRERFYPDFSFWSRADYYAHWRQASDALDAGQAVSFIQCMYDSATSNFYQVWAAYPCNGEVIFQEQLLILDEIKADFNAQYMHLNAQPYEAVSEDGDPISEWRTQSNLSA